MEICHLYMCLMTTLAVIKYIELNAILRMLNLMLFPCGVLIKHSTLEVMYGYVPTNDCSLNDHHSFNLTNWYSSYHIHIHVQTAKIPNFEALY